VVLLLFDLLQQQQAILHAVQALAACSFVLVFTAGIIKQYNAAISRRLPCPGWCQHVSLLQHLMRQKSRTAEH
jgi:hypothetical protein